jgi:hypothetical protein
MSQLAQRAKNAIFNLALEMRFQDPLTDEGPTTEETLRKRTEGRVSTIIKAFLKC